MNTIYFDCAGGAAGDMLIGALLDAGADFGLLTREIGKLNLPGVECTLTRVKRNAIDAAKFDVSFPHEHAHRHLADIEAIIQNAGYNESVTTNALAVFTIIAEAEAKMHNIDIAKVHFHEVGAVDSIVDIVGFCILIDSLAVNTVVSSPLPFGHGEIRTAHGTMPNPAPATAEITRGLPTYAKDVAGELVTPTAAALLKHFAQTFTFGIDGRVSHIGYGAGTKEYTNSSSMTRVLLLEAEPATDNHTARIIECNIDDMSGEALAYASERLRSCGADDVWTTPIVMKKGRAAIALSVLVGDDDLTPYLEIIFGETSTIGVRVHTVDKIRLPRKTVIVTTEYGDVRLKVAEYSGSTKAKPEYDDCVRIAEEHGVPFRVVYERALRAWEEESPQSP